MIRDLWFRMRALLRRKSVETELEDELRFHLEQQVEKYAQGGMSREEARRQARLEFGGIELAKEECRDARGVRFLETLFQDVRYGLRMLSKSPGLELAPTRQSFNCWMRFACAIRRLQIRDNSPPCALSAAIAAWESIKTTGT